MSDFDYFPERTAAQKINERIEQTRRSRVAGRRHRRALPGVHLRRNR